MKIAFTGHRPNKLGGYYDSNNCELKFRHELLYYFVNNGIKIKKVKFITGMALGIDQFAAKFAIEFNIPFYAYIPCKYHEKRWPLNSQIQYHGILHYADEVIYVSKLPYSNTCMQDRNIAMVNNCNFLIAVWNGSSGGTSNCIRYARSINKKVHIINPDSWR